MLAPDVVQLREFYATELGQIVAATLARQIERWWPDAPGDTLLGVGYPTPYLGRWTERTDLTAVLMPVAQGAAYWPVGKPNVTLLADDAQLPIADHRINRVLMVHAVENSEHLRRMLEEIWRVLTPGGKVLAVVPNRRGIWARAPISPFAHGQPFSQRQLRGVFADTHFTITRVQHALYIPPLRARWLRHAARSFEALSSVLFPGFGGVILMEAEKQIYATTRGMVKASRPSPVYATKPAVASTRHLP